jgi:hypothetical protein
LGSGRAGNGSGRTGTEQRKRRGGAAFSSFLRRARRWSRRRRPRDVRCLACRRRCGVVGRCSYCWAHPRGWSRRRWPCRYRAWHRGCATHLLIISPRSPATSGARSPVSAERGRRGASRRGRLCVASVRARAIRPRRPKIAARGSERGSVVWV